MARSTFLAWLLLAVSACTGGQTGSEGVLVDGPGKGNDDMPDGGRGSSAGGEDCGDAGVDAAVLDWDEPSEVGSASEVFGAAEGSCEAELRWNGAPFDDRTIEPVSGTSMVTVELTLDHDSARWIERRERAGLEPPCGGYLVAQGHVTLETADGTFDAQSDVTLTRSLDGESVTYGFDQDVADHEGSLSIELRDGERGTLAYQIDGSGAACAGAINLTVSSSRNGLGMAGGGQLAAWSDSACPLGQEAYDLTEPGPNGSTLAEAIGSSWRETSHPGTWLDGAQAELALAVEVPGQVACRERGGSGAVEVPVRATYSTSDGRLQERTADASVRATLDEAGAVKQLDFWLSDEQVCESESDVLDYQPADCGELESITVQLGWNDYRDGAPQATDGGLNVYFTPRGGGEPPPGDRLAL